MLLLGCFCATRNERNGPTTAYIHLKVSSPLCHVKLNIFQILPLSFANPREHKLKPQFSVKCGKEACWSCPKHPGKHKFCPCPIAHDLLCVLSLIQPCCFSSKQCLPTTAQQVLAEIRAPHWRMNRCSVVQNQWYSHVMTSQGTQMKKNYQPRRLQLGLLSWGIKVSLWKSPSSASTGHTSGAEPGGPGLFCQGVNWLPVPVLPVCG